MTGTYTEFALRWQTHEITVSYQADWLGSGQWHIELRCSDPLPVTSTGYRSHFVPSGELEDEVAIRGFVVDWLDRAAQTPEWRRQQEESR